MLPYEAVMISEALQAYRDDEGTPSEMEVPRGDVYTVHIHA